MAVDKDKNLSAAVELRRQAEERLRENKGTSYPSGTEEDPLRLLHELQVHQIELEMQNEELRQARDKMETALDKYTDLYDLAPVGYVTLDRDGTIRAANLTSVSLLGIERSRLIGRRFGLFVADEARPLFSEFLGKVFARQGKESCEVALTREGNHPLFVQIEAVAAASGQECRAAILNISERKQLEEKLKILHSDLAARSAELEAANIDLEGANIELEAFNSTVSHDLRKPLTVIHGYCQILRDLCSDQINEQSLGYIREMEEGSLRMNRLIDTLLAFSSASHVEISREKVDLSKMAEEVALGLKVSEPERLITFWSAAGIIADGDPDLLRVVLNNLIDNAWKYTDKRKETVIEFGMRELEGKQAYFVRDNGPGFDMAFADNLFIKPFQRPHRADVKGYGIGLLTVEGIVRRHGGRVWAEGEVGKGATFYFTL